MYVCICNAVTESQVRNAVEAGIADLWGLQRELGVASGCGACKDMAAEILREKRNATATIEPVRYMPNTA